jgi:hypothetical protein
MAFFEHLTFFTHFFLYLFISLAVQGSGTDTQAGLMYRYTVDFLVQFACLGNKGSQNSRVCLCHLVAAQAFVGIVTPKPLGTPSL